MGHWYTKDGEERFDAGIRIARDEGLLPSVTTILGVMDKGTWLANWKRDQAIMQAMTLPTIENEPADAYAARVVKALDEEQQKTMAVGRGVHALCELHLGAEPIDGDIPIESYRAYQDSQVEVGYLNPLLHKANGTGQAEKIVVSELGYAGRLDFGWQQGSALGTRDFKTQGVKKRDGRPSPGFYADWAAQLTAYAVAMGALSDERRAEQWLPECDIGSIVISTSRHRGSWERKWSKNAITKGWWTFVACFELWKVVHSYDPSRLF